MLPYYRISGGEALPMRMIHHVRWFSTNHYVGLSPIEVHAESLGLAQAVRQYTGKSFAKAIPFREFVQAQIAAEQVMTGKVPDPTGGATHYYATTLPKAPAWTVGAKQTFRLGHHVFFRDVP
ncbi:cell wall hydrolase [Pseudomonas lini]|nr:cell wall hydrolase [Pseudomonas lini]